MSCLPWSGRRWVRNKSFPNEKKKLRSLRFLTCFIRIARNVTFYIVPYIVVHCLNHAFVLEVLLWHIKTVYNPGCKYSVETAVANFAKPNSGLLPNTPITPRIVYRFHTSYLVWYDVDFTNGCPCCCGSCWRRVCGCWLHRCSRRICTIVGWHVPTSFSLACGSGN